MGLLYVGMGLLYVGMGSYGHASTTNSIDHRVASAPKILYTPLPVLFVTVNHFAAQRKVVREMFGPQGPYEAPTYKYAVRGDGYPGNPDIKNFFFFVQLKCTPDKPPLHWGLRGLALFAISGN